MTRILLYILLTAPLIPKDIIAVLELEQSGLNPEQAQTLTQRLTTKLISIGKYEVVERVSMDKILKEQKIQNSGCTDSKCAVEIGQLLNTDYIVIGRVSKFSSTYAIDARLIDVSLGKSIVSAEFSIKGELDELLTTGMTAISNQLCGLDSEKKVEPKQKFASQVTKVKSKEGYVNISIKPQAALLFIDTDIVSNNSTSKYKIGKHKFTASLKNYYQIHKTFFIHNNDTSFINHTLQYGLFDLKKLQKHKKYRFYGSITATGVTLVSYLIAELFYNKYIDTESPQDAIDLRNQTQFFDTITNISALVSTSAWGYTLYNYNAEESLKKELNIDK